MSQHRCPVTARGVSLPQTRATGTGVGRVRARVRAIRPAGAPPGSLTPRPHLHHPTGLTLTWQPRLVDLGPPTIYPFSPNIASKSFSVNDPSLSPLRRVVHHACTDYAHRLVVLGRNHGGTVQTCVRTAVRRRAALGGITIGRASGKDVENARTTR